MCDLNVASGVLSVEDPKQVGVLRVGVHRGPLLVPFTQVLLHGWVLKATIAIPPLTMKTSKLLATKPSQPHQESVPPWPFCVVGGLCALTAFALTRHGVYPQKGPDTLD